MPSLYAHQSSNIAKTWLLMAAFLVLIIVIAWLFSYALNDVSILYGGVILALVMNFASYWWSDKLVIAMTGAKPADPKIYRELYRIVENLGITAGLSMPKVYILNEPQPNAFATGRDQKHAVVAVTTGLLDILDRAELEGVLAHELSHIGNRDMLVSTMAVMLVGFIAIISDFFLRITFHSSRSRDSKGSPVILVAALVAAILAPLAATLLRLAISRKREFLADASGALLTRYPDGLARALKKISASPAPLRRASNATAHLFFANPFKGDQAAGWFAKLFMTHPPVQERIAALAGMDTKGELR